MLSEDESNSLCSSPIHKESPLPISDEALLQMMLKQHEGQPIEFIMAEYGKVKRFYLEIEQGLAQGLTQRIIEVEPKQTSGKLPTGTTTEPIQEKVYKKNELVVKPKDSITEDDIFCCICGRGFKVLNKRHLQSHGITVKEYRKLCGYPEGQPLMSEKEAKAYRERGKNMAQARAEKLSTKTDEQTKSAAE